MKSFIRENPTLAFGLGLPLLIVIVFSLAAGLPNLMAPTPKYDVLFSANNYYNAYEGLQINVVHGKVTARFVGECNYCQPPELYIYNSARGSLRRINITYPPGIRTDGKPSEASRNRVLPVEIPELAELTLDDANPAPDGYQFMTNENYSEAGILPGLFFGYRYNYGEPVLRKGNAQIRLSLNRGYYNSSNVRFIGWVVPKP